MINILYCDIRLIITIDNFFKKILKLNFYKMERIKRDKKNP